MLTTDHNLRHLRIFLAMVESGSVTRAARISNLSQPAVTQVLNKLEAQMGTTLFDRSRQGLFVTEPGRTFAQRVVRALDILDRASANLAPRLQSTATTAKLKALIAVAEAENFSLAARHLGIAQPTVHRAITQLEAEVGRSLFKRSRYGSVPTRAGKLLASASQLAFAELAQAEMALIEAIGQGTLRIIVGGMPLSRSYILPEAIAKFQIEHHNVLIQVREGPYDALLAGLLRGEIDFLFGALRDPLPVEDIVQDHLFEDQLVAVCGPDHPLIENKALEASHLLDYPWVVAMPDTPARTQFDAFMKDRTGGQPLSLVETSSMILMRELLHSGPYLGCISRLQAISEVRKGLMNLLPVTFEQSHRTIGITARVNWKPTRTQDAFLSLVRQNFER